MGRDISPKSYQINRIIELRNLHKKYKDRNLNEEKNKKLLIN